MRKMFTLFVFAVFCFVKGWAQAPENDECAGAIPLTCGGGYSGSTNGANMDVIQANNDLFVGFAGVWFTYSATTSGLVTFSLADNGIDALYTRVYTGTCASLTFTGIFNHYKEGFSSLAVTSGTTYYIWLGSTLSDNTSLPYTITTTCTIANDSCSNAADLTCNSTYAGNNTNATDETITPDPYNPANNCGYITAGRYKGEWFHYHAATDGLLTLTSVSAWAPALRVYSGSCGTLTCAGHQEYGDFTSDYKWHNSLTIPVTAGTDYYVLLAGFSSRDYGEFTLSTDCVCAAAIGTQPVSASYCQNATPAPLSVAATGFIISYQWYVNTTSSKEGGTPVGNNSSTFTPATAATGTRYYYAVVNGSCNADTSAIAAVNVGAPITSATLSAQQTQICYGSQILLTASAQSGSKTTYTYNYINVNDNSSTGYINNKSKNEPAGSYVVAVKNSGGCIDTTNMVTITQPALPITVTTSVLNGVCGGNGSAQISAAGGYSDFVYTINTSPEVGKATPYTFNYLAQGKYTLTAIDARGCAQTKSVTVANTTKVPSPTGFAGPATVTAYSTQSYHVDSIDRVSYNWSVPSDAVVVSGQGTATASIKWGYKSGKIKIIPSSSCGTGKATQYSIIVRHANSFQPNVITNVVVKPGNGISVYPNPTRDMATLQFTSAGEAKYLINVTDMRGKQILHKEGAAGRGTNQVKLDLRNVANGVYFIRLSDGKTVQNIKLVKED